MTSQESFGCVIHGAQSLPEQFVEEIKVPWTGETWATVHTSVDAAAEAVRDAHDAFVADSWRPKSGAERAALMRSLADLVMEHAAEFSRYEKLATGKTAGATSGEANSLAKRLRYYAWLAEDSEGRLVDLRGDSDVRVVHEPVGVVVAILPFNGPLSLGSWKIAPALAAGNAVVAKPPAQGAGSLLLLARLAVEAGFPPGILNVVPGGAEVGTALVDQPAVGLVSFTGSTRVAAELGGRVTAQMKRFLCEAGGKSAQVVFADADIDSALAGVAQGIFSNAGQSCVAGSRLLLDASIHDAFLERLVERCQRLVVGDPDDAGTDVGPVASAQQLERVTGMVTRALDDGAVALAGGRPAKLPEPLTGGYFFEPTILGQIQKDKEAWREEIFGPVLCVSSFDTEEEAITTANDSDYGLAAGVWTIDLRRAHRVSRRLEAGTIWVNTYRIMDYRVPFGGYKKSGFGRENGHEVLAEFSNTKAIVSDYGRQADSFPSSRTTSATGTVR